MTGEPLNPGRCAEANAGWPSPCPLIAGHGSGMCYCDWRHVTHMLNAGRRVRMFAPNGTCQPVRNPAAMRHEANDLMRDQDRMARRRPARGTTHSKSRPRA